MLTHRDPQYSLQKVWAGALVSWYVCPQYFPSGKSALSSAYMWLKIRASLASCRLWEMGSEDTAGPWGALYVEHPQAPDSLTAVQGKVYANTACCSPDTSLRTCLFFCEGKQVLPISSSFSTHALISSGSPRAGGKALPSQVWGPLVLSHLGWSVCRSPSEPSSLSSTGEQAPMLSPTRYLPEILIRM